MERRQKMIVRVVCHEEGLSPRRQSLDRRSGGGRDWASQRCTAG